MNLQWRVYLTENSKFRFLDKNLSRLTKWYIFKKYDKFRDSWEDIYHDLVLKVMLKRNDILSGISKPIKNFRGWYYYVMKNHLINIAIKQKREKRKLTEYHKISNSENMEENTMNEKEMIIKFTKIMAIQHNRTHVEIFIDFVQGKSYSEISNRHNISKENARKIVERMRKECRKLWESDRIKAFDNYVIESVKEANVLFGRKREEAMKSLIQKLISELPIEYREYIWELLTR